MADRYTARHAAWRVKRSRRRPTRQLLPAAAALTVAGVLLGGAGAALQLDKPADVSTDSLALYPSDSRADAADRASRGDIRLAVPSTKPTAAPTRKASLKPSSKPTAAQAQPSGSGSVAYSGSCKASYYDEPQGTANGETFNPEAYTAASKTLPFNTRVRVTNLANGESVVVRINDRGPYVASRCLDLSRASFRAIASLSMGVINIRYDVLRG